MTSTQSRAMMAAAAAATAVFLLLSLSSILTLSIATSNIAATTNPGNDAGTPHPRHSHEGPTSPSLHERLSQRRRMIEEDVIDDDNVVIDDEGALSSLFTDDGDVDRDSNSTNSTVNDDATDRDDDEEWYLPESKITSPVLRAFGAGSANDWGLVLSMIGGSGSGSGSGNNDGNGALNGNGIDDGGNETHGENVFLDGNSDGEVLFSYAVPLVSWNPGYLDGNVDGNSNLDETQQQEEDEDSLYRISAGNVHSAILTLQGKVYTAGSGGLGEDHGLGRSLDEGDYDLSGYIFSWGSGSSGGLDDGVTAGVTDGLDDDIVTEEVDDIVTVNDTDDNITYSYEDDMGMGDELDNATISMTSSTSTSTAATRPSRPTTTTTTTAATTSSSSRRQIEIAPTIYSFQPITEIYIYSPSSDTHVLQSLPSADLPKFTQIQTSQYFTFLLDDQGRVYATGINTHGQLCLNDTESRDRFYEVPPSFLFEDAMEEELRIADVALGERHTLLLRGDGTVLACGWNAYGQLGVGTTEEAVVKPVVVVIDVPDLEMEETVEEVGSDGNAVGNTADDGIFDGNKTNITVVGNASDTTTPPKVIANITTSPTDTIDASHPPSASPSQPPALPPIPINTRAIAAISAGRGSSYFLTRSGHVFSTGTNYEGQLCLGHRDDRTLPSLVDTIDYAPSSFSENRTSVRSMVAGRSSVYFQMEDGSVYSCGSNTHGQLGIGSFDLESVDVPRPVLLARYEDDVDQDSPNTTDFNFDFNSTTANSTNLHDHPRPPLHNIIHIFSGPMAYNAFFLSANGTLYAVGYNGAGQLGVGDEIHRPAAAVVACSDRELGMDDRVIWTESAIEQRTFVSSGNDHVLFLGREEWFWGCGGETGGGGSGGGTDGDGGGIFFPPSNGGGEEDADRESTMAPTASVAPSTSFLPSVAPSVSSAPSTSFMPSAVPSVSGMPTITPRPTEEELSNVPTFDPTLGYGSYPPTLSWEDAVGSPEDESGSGGGGSDRGVESGVSRIRSGWCGFHFGVTLFVVGMMMVWW